MQQQEQLDASSMTRMAIMQVLVAQLAKPQGVMDDRSIVAFASLLLKTHAWCVREEMANRLKMAQEKAPLDRNVVHELFTTAMEERVDHAKRLTAFAMFHASTMHLPKPKVMQ